MLNVKAIIIVFKMTSYCAGTVQMREESEGGMRKWEEMWFKATAEDGERGKSVITAVTCDGRLFHKRAAAKTLCHRQWTDKYVERQRRWSDRTFTFLNAHSVTTAPHD